MKNAVGQKVLDLIMLGAASRKPNAQNQDGRESGRSQSQKTGAKSQHTRGRSAHSQMQATDDTQTPNKSSKSVKSLLEFGSAYNAAQKISKSKSTRDN